MEMGGSAGAGSVGAQNYKTKSMWLKSNKTNLNTLLNRAQQSNAGGVFSEKAGAQQPVLQQFGDAGGSTRSVL
jgi:hypothetical protein